MIFHVTGIVIGKSNQIKSHQITGLLSLFVGYLTSCDIYTNTLHLLTRLIFNTNKNSMVKQFLLIFIIVGQNTFYSRLIKMNDYYNNFCEF